MPALFDTTVKSLKSGLSLRALIRVAGTPENPNPPTSKVLPLCISRIASCADGHILLIANLAHELENWRRVHNRAKGEFATNEIRDDFILALNTISMRKYIKHCHVRL